MIFLLKVGALIVFCGDTFHLYQPLRSAHRGVKKNMGNSGIVGAEVLINSLVVSEVTEVDDEVADVNHRGLAIVEQCTDVFQQSLGLLRYVFEVHHLSVSVNAGRTGDVVRSEVGQREPCATFKGDTILMCGVEMISDSHVSSWLAMSAICCSMLPCLCDLNI
jgi:hypothetical protein